MVIVPLRQRIANTASLVADETGLDKRSEKRRRRTTELLHSPTPLPPSTLIINTSQSQTTLVVVPRILKNDIRRQYALMFANVMNSYDANMMKAFLRQYGQKDVRMDKLFSPSIVFASPIGSNTIFPAYGSCASRRAVDVSVKGADNISQYWQMMNVMTPDRVFSIEDTKIHTKPDSMACTLTSRFRVQGTFLLDITKDDVMSHMMGVVAGMFSSDPTSSSRSMLDLLAYASLRYGRDVFHKRPDLHVNGEFSVYIDEHRRIERLQLRPVPLATLQPLVMI